MEIRSIKQYMGEERYSQHIKEAKESAMYGIRLADVEKDDLYAVIGFLSKNYELIKWRDRDGNP